MFDPGRFQKYRVNPSNVRNWPYPAVADAQQSHRCGKSDRGLDAIFSVVILFFDVLSGLLRPVVNF
jgi:hypothetical protein